MLIGEDLLQGGDAGVQRVQLVLNLLPLQTGEAAQRHFDNGVSLHVVESEPLDQVGLGFRAHPSMSG